jgi:hypothetical protein
MRCSSIRLGDFIGGGLIAGESTIVIATEPHFNALEQRLAPAGVDVARAIAEGRYIALIAEKALNKFIVNDWPDLHLFEEFVTGRAAVGARRHCSDYPARTPLARDMQKPRLLPPVCLPEDGLHGGRFRIVRRDPCRAHESHLTHRAATSRSLKFHFPDRRKTLPDIGLDDPLEFVRGCRSVSLVVVYKQIASEAAAEGDREVATEDRFHENRLFRRRQTFRPLRHAVGTGRPAIQFPDSHVHARLSRLHYHFAFTA